MPVRMSALLFLLLQAKGEEMVRKCAAAGANIILLPVM